MFSREHGVEVDFPSEGFLLAVLKSLPENAKVAGGTVSFAAEGILPFCRNSNDEDRYLGECMAAKIKPFSARSISYDIRSGLFLPLEIPLSKNAWFLDDRAYNFLSPKALNLVSQAYSEIRGEHLVTVRMEDPRSKYAQYQYADKAAEQFSKDYLDRLLEQRYRLFAGFLQIQGCTDCGFESDGELDFSVTDPLADRRGNFQFRRYYMLNQAVFDNLCCWIDNLAAEYGQTTRPMSIHLNPTSN